MGIIEDNIFANYKRALKDGNLKHAEKAVELVKILRGFIENGEFTDYPAENASFVTSIGNFFDPFPYKYDENKGLVIVQDSAVYLTDIENRLFAFLSSKASALDKINFIQTSEIKTKLWPERLMSNALVRINVLRLRKKLEPDIKNPQIIFNVYSRGYVFLGRRVEM